ncbi:MAG: hypothetical protein V4712_07480 [Pseudomonadota bacterium]
MRSSFVSGLVALTLLAACSPGIGANAGRDDDHPGVCQVQNDLARLGKTPTGEIDISCPEHGIGAVYQ